MNPKTKTWVELERIQPEPYVKSTEPKVHLFVKGEFKLVCMPNKSVGNKLATISPSKVTCRNCINKSVRQAKNK